MRHPSLRAVLTGRTCECTREGAGNYPSTRPSVRKGTLGESSVYVVGSRCWNVITCLVGLATSLNRPGSPAGTHAAPSTVRVGRFGKVSIVRYVSPICHKAVKPIGDTMPWWSHERPCGAGCVAVEGASCGVGESVIADLSLPTPLAFAQVGLLGGYGASRRVRAPPSTMIVCPPIVVLGL